jgi:hypothetical protein
MAQTADAPNLIEVWISRYLKEAGLERIATATPIRTDSKSTAATFAHRSGLVPNAVLMIGESYA